MLPNTMMRYIREGIKHAFDGDFYSFFCEELKQFDHRKKYRNISKKTQEWSNFCVSKTPVKPIKIQPGVRLQLYTDSELCRLIYLDRFEGKERDFLNRFLSKGDIFIDVGANIGIFTVIASKLVGKQGCVYAFEPCSTTYKRLRENLNLNHCANVDILNAALSDENGSLGLTISVDGFDAWNSFGNPTSGQSFESEIVQTIRWDSFAQENGLVGKVTMMKIDVEGWESHVLRGGEETLSRPDAPLLQVEFTETNCRNNGFSCRELYKLLQDFGYQMFLYDSESFTLIPEPLREDYPYLNLIATKDPTSVVKKLSRKFR